MGVVIKMENKIKKMSLCYKQEEEFGILLKELVLRGFSIIKQKNNILARKGNLNFDITLVWSGKLGAFICPIKYNSEINEYSRIKFFGEVQKPLRLNEIKDLDFYLNSFKGEFNK